MALRLVTGPANSGKAGEVLGAYRARLDEDPLLVVPRLEDVEHSRRELAERGVVLGARVVRFGRLFELIADRAGARDGPVRRASAVQRRLVMAAAVEDAGLEVMADSARRPGFVAAALRFVTELERAMIEPERLRRAMRAWAGGGAARRYADEIARIYAAYRARLDAADLVDDETFARRALDALRREPRRWGGTAVFLYGFDDFTALELDALETVALRCGAEVVCSLAFEPGRAAFRATAATFARLAELAEGRVALAASAEHYADAARGPLHHLERALFDGVEERLDPGRAVRLLVAGGERAEVEQVAAEVLRLLREGVRPGDVAVVFRDPARYASLLEQVFGAHGIPFSLDRRVPLAHTAVGRGLLALLRCRRPEGTDEDLVAYLRALGRRGAPDLADRLEARARRRGIRDVDGARAAWEAERGPFEEVDRLRGARRPAVLLDELDRQLERLFGDPYRRRARLLSGPDSADARALAVAREAIAGMRALADADAGLRLDLARVEDVLADLPVAIGEEPGADRVRVAAPEQLRARRFQAVLVCGLQEGEFPRPGAPEPFLPDEARREVARAGGLALPLRENELDRERYLFYVCASRAERLLVLSSRVSDEEGNPQARSFYLDDVRELLDAEALDAGAGRRALAEVTWTPEAAPTRVEWERALAARGPRRRAPAPDGLDAPEVLAELRARRDFSAAALETFSGCGVRWLVEELVDPRALEPDPEPMVRGRYAHAVLRATFERLRERTGDRAVTPENLATAEQILLEALREQRSEFRLSPKGTRVRAAARKLEFDLLRHLRHEADAGSSFEPAELELGFGVAPEGELGLPALELEPEGLRIRGRIDRVDTHDGHAVVRDYKSGTAVSGAGEWEARGRLQAPLYMLAVRELLGLEPVAGLYVPLAGPARSPRGLVSAPWAEAVEGDLDPRDVRPPEAVEALLERARQKACEAVARARAGELRPCPDTCAWNGGCSYPALCGVEGG